MVMSGSKDQVIFIIIIYGRVSVIPSTVPSSELEFIFLKEI